MRLAALLVLLSTPAWAQEKPAPAPQSAAAGGTALVVQDTAAARRLFGRLDRNGDGYLSTDELRAAVGEDQNWMAVDRNRDGRIAPDELTVVTAPPGRRSP